MMVMETIKIAHLYYDIMNLYGENGNIRFLKKKFEDQGINTEVYFLSMEDEIDFSKYDFYYIGSGTDNNKKIVLDNFKKYRNNIKDAIYSNKYFLITGNAIDMFGKTINTVDGKEIEALDIFNYITTEEEFRIIDDQYFQSDLIDEKIIGFQNRASVMCKYSNNLFTVIKGVGSAPNIDTEGILYNNFYGTYLVGPLLVRNPFFTDYIVEKMCKERNFKYTKPNCDDYSYKAYFEFINNFYKNQE